MRIGWLADQSSHLGGAELTSAEFRAATPDEVEIVDCPAGGVDRTCDRYVVQNCVTYTLDDFNWPGYRPVTKYNHDVGPHMRADVAEWLRTNASNVCCSPVQAEYMQLESILIPPPIDVSRYTQAAAKSNGARAGVVCVASWRNFGKAPHKALEWAESMGQTLDFYGGGDLAPPSSRQIPPDAMPALLASYKTFVFLPTVIEPFGRLVAEADAAGCEVIANDLVGAKYWLEEAPEKIESAAEDFWRVVLS